MGFHAPGNAYLVMKYLEGESLASRSPASPPVAQHGPRWPWIVGAVVLAGGGVAALKARRHVEVPAAEPFCAITPPPILDGASTEPVLLRYSFAAGQKTEVTAIAQTTTAGTLANGAKTSDDMTITLEGTLYWTSAEASTFLGRLEIEKISVDRALVTTPLSGPQEHDTVHWRSDGASPPPANLEPLLGLTGLPLAITVDARGEVAAPGIQAWQGMLERETAIPALRAAFQRDEVFRTMFLRLPDQPVRVGDHWRAGELVRALPNVGQVSAKIELRVAAVSKDGTQALLDAAPELQVDLSGTATVRTQRSALRMWSQFDLRRHDVAASAMRACVEVELDGGIATQLELVASYDPLPGGVDEVR